MPSRSRRATTGGAPAAAPSGSPFATARTRARSSHPQGSPSRKRRSSGSAAASPLPAVPSATARTRSSTLLLSRAPAPVLPLVVAEAAFHLAAVHAAGEVAAQARLVDIGEADLRPAHVGVAQPALHGAEGHGAVDLLESLVERELALLAAGVERPGA